MIFNQDNSDLVGAINAITPLDTTPTSGSTKGITSGAVYTALSNKIGTLIASEYFGDPFSKTYTLPTGMFSLWLIGYGLPGGNQTAKGQYILSVGAAGNVQVHPIIEDNKFSFNTNTFQINITTSTAYYTGVIITSMIN